MSKEKTDIPPVATGIFTLPPYDQSPPRLLGGICSKCNKYYFPRPGYCRSCLEPTEETALDSKGVIYSYTVIRTKAPLGLPAPYSVGYIDLAGSSLRIFCLLDPAAIEQLQVGLKVRLAVGPLGHDGHGSPCLRPYFTPQKLE
jgi:uncharacterized OB-fold protein